MSERTEYDIELVAKIAAVLLPPANERVEVDYHAAAVQALRLLDASRDAALQHYRAIWRVSQKHVPGKKIFKSITGMKKNADAQRNYRRYRQWLESTSLDAQPSG